MGVTKILRVSVDIATFLSLLIYVSIVGIFSRPKGFTWFRNTAYAAVRILTARQAILDLRKRQTSVDSYKTYTSKRGLPQEITPLGNDAHLLWIGPPDAEHVLYHFHGGGYLTHAGLPHYLMLHDLIIHAKERGKSLRVAMLHYGLCPETSYPTQLIQAVEGLNYLLETSKIPASKILIAGDSAGGNLALSLIAHVMHPHSTIEAINLPADDSKFIGLFLESPYISFDDRSPSWKANKNKDIITTALLQRSATGYLGGAARDFYNEPFAAPIEFWDHIPARIIKIYYGTYEVFADDVRVFGERLKPGNPQIEMLAVEHDVHCQNLIDTTITEKVEKSGHFFRDWIMNAI
ncbi:alpha/beta-hydrolase [Dissoconium aciculare CBS 342.82]|uniref:Alpha/beta-hydrolase n=1 Tax=Dissoconium aciculare CBS 342.82 TaxID=1314786 RepID=A0A6J3MFR6_9PEZI|nr:alpha/beta-hydrolase [Dissoconium aciculare CBS 342.82]KAF1826836.1 alpha/beta-hydrolase [Dissoconium aciculare CBS 342.82]